jgi:hypothetical protein
VDLKDARVTDFAPFVGDRFRTDAPLGMIGELELVEAQPLPTRPGAPRSEPFSLIFRGPTSQPFPQGVYRLEHDQFGPLGLFLVPIGPARDAEGLDYQVIFN